MGVSRGGKQAFVVAAAELGGDSGFHAWFHRRERATRALDTGLGTLDPKYDRVVCYVAADVPMAAAQVWCGLEEALREDGSFLKWSGANGG